MAVTGTSEFSLMRDDMIRAVLRTLGVLASGELPEAEDYRNCSQALNVLIKSWEKKGLPLWVTVQWPITLLSGVAAYPLGAEGGSLYSIQIVNGGSATESGTWTATDADGLAEASGSYLVEDGTVTSMQIADAGMGFTTLPAIFTLDPEVPGVEFSVKILGRGGPKPLKILQEGTFIRSAAGYDTTLLQISRQEYNQQGNKSSPGIPNQFYYDIGVDSGMLYLLNVPIDATQMLYLQTQRPFFDMVAETDDFDFPSEWFQALKWGGCAELAAEYGVPLQMISYYEQKASMLLEECFAFSVEEASTMFTADMRGGR